MTDLTAIVVLIDPDDAAVGIAEFLGRSRLAGEAALAARFARAVAEGDLDGAADPVALARFVMVVAEGQAVHAAAGVGRTQLLRSAEIALRAIPAPEALDGPRRR